MALPYPEGEVFFRRSKLKVPKSGWENDWSFDADKTQDFVSHVLIEYVWNHPSSPHGTRSFPLQVDLKDRSGHRPNAVNVMFSKTDQPAPHSGRHPPGVVLDKWHAIDTSYDDIEYAKKAAGGPSKVTLLPVPAPPGARYLWIDLVVPVRAIYLPLAQHVDTRYPDLCSYILVDFRLRKGTQMMFPDYKSPGPQSPSLLGTLLPALTLANIVKDRLKDVNQSLDKFAEEIVKIGMDEKVIALVKVLLQEGLQRQIDANQDPATDTSKTHPNHKWQPFNYKDGLRIQDGRTLQVDILGVYNLLILSRQMRNPDKGLYMPTDPKDTLIKNYPASFTNTTYYDIHPERRAFQLLDYAEVIADHFGVDVVWQPYEFKEETKSMVAHFFHHIVGTGLCMIPIIGPLASSSYNVFLEALVDPKSFTAKNVLRLDGEIVKGIIASGLGVLPNLAGGPKLTRTLISAT